MPFRRVVSATWVSTTALLIGTAFVVVAFSAEGKPTRSNTWYEYAPTFMALGAVILRGSLAALLGIALYQHLWQNIVAPTSDKGKPLLGISNNKGITLDMIESLDLISRLAVGMFGYPSLKLGWIIGVLGLAVTSAVQPVLQSSTTVRQERQTIQKGVPIYHPQFNGSLAQSDSAVMLAGAATTIPRRSAIAALLGEQSNLQYTDSNVIGPATFGSVRYLDADCNIEAIPGKKSNLNGWDVYNFTYRYPDARSFSDEDTKYDLTKWRDVYNTSVLYEGVDIRTALKSKIEVQSVTFNNTH